MASGNAVIASGRKRPACPKEKPAKAGWHLAEAREENRDAVMRLCDYDIFDPPINVPFDQLKPKQASTYFEWFLSHISERLAGLQREFDRANCGDLDFSLDSLNRLELWFEPLVQMRLKTDEEIARDRESVPVWLRGRVSDSDLDELTYSLCFDIAFYFGETLLRRNASFYWELNKRPRSSADLNQPVVTSENAVTHVNPVGLLTVLARKIADHRKPENELVRLLLLWEAAIQAK